MRKPRENTKRLGQRHGLQTPHGGDALGRAVSELTVWAPEDLGRPELRRQPLPPHFSFHSDPHHVLNKFFFLSFFKCECYLTKSNCDHGLRKPLAGCEEQELALTQQASSIDLETQKACLPCAGFASLGSPCQVRCWTSTLKWTV